MRVELLLGDVEVRENVFGVLDPLDHRSRQFDKLLFRQVRVLRLVYRGSNLHSGTWCFVHNSNHYHKKVGKSSR